MMSQWWPLCNLRNEITAAETCTRNVSSAPLATAYGNTEME